MRSGQRAPPYRPWRPNPAGVGELGLAVASQEALVFLSASRMFHFAAPEVASGASPARDYRSFGMIVLEPLTGSHPFAGLSEAVITAQLTTRAAGTSVVEDPRWRNLCRWLLVRDPRDRWGADQVVAWLGGADPEVYDDSGAAPTTTQTPYRTRRRPNTPPARRHRADPSPPGHAGRRRRCRRRPRPGPNRGPACRSDDPRRALIR